jgi:HPt (histidine-containing phosphotransfer) domain-containing protein
MIPSDAIEQMSAPPLAPSESQGDPIIDCGHLARMTLGDRSLEIEVLALFDRQAEILLARMRQAPPAAVGTFAHTLKGSARGIGAWRVAAAAERLERAAAGAAAAELPTLLGGLAGAVDEARAAIAELAATAAQVR